MFNDAIVRKAGVFVSTFVTVSEADFRTRGTCVTKNKDIRELCEGVSDFQKALYAGE
jgi:hypothetical protein